MALVPFERLTLRSRLKSDELYRRLAAAVEPARWYRNPFSREQHKPYEGEIAPNGFRINRVIRYRNSFLPTIIGRIRADEAGSEIEMVLRLHLAVAVFMVVWLGGAAAAATVGAVEVLRGHPSPAGLIPLAMFVFGYVLMQAGFVVESRRAKRFFDEVIR